MGRLVITIADTMFGYGSPQIAQLTASICNLTGRRGIVVQPLFPGRAFVQSNFKEFSLETISTSVHPYSVPGRMEYVGECLRLINQYKPDILILTNYILFDILDGIEYKPRKVIHLALEDVDSVIASPSGDLRLSRIMRQSKFVDIWIFPEFNRAARDSELFRVNAISVLYNCNRTSIKNTYSTGERNGKIIYAGTLDTAVSVAKYIFDDDILNIPIDVYGDLQGDPATSVNNMLWKIAQLKKLGSKHRVHWINQVSAEVLEELLPHYLYSILFWLPARHALINAAPNKFFQAISAGVPVITAPHPQPKMLIERYGCGIVLAGWEKEHFVSGLRKALAICKSAAYSEMVENCLAAAKVELNWERQFEKFAKQFNAKEW